MSDSIKVAIKVRPLIKREKEENLSIQWITKENTIVATDVEYKKRSDGGYEFDHVFDMNANNNDVFDNVVKPIVNAAVNGFNGTVFAYGQTSSGKTYTMMGTSEEPGIIPLAVEHMFDAITNIPGREFLLRVSYLEIYNEKVNDLLNKDSIDLKVHEDVNSQVFVKCKEEVTNCPENVLAIMNKGNKNRRIGETNMNERSSRSHTIFRITIESREAGADSEGAIQVSQLNMVDLAGSERARLTGATGERFKEGRHINLSLSTLALVIKQLSESQDYVNFRDSKLTRLLQASLGGNAMTVIICAVTPAALDETQCTLSFASRARNIKNDPKLNEVMSDGVLLKRYAKQIDKLHTELERMKQLNRTTDFKEMESKMQEKDRINQNLEERIRLLQTRIVTAANRNATSIKNKEKRRQTWCGTGGFNKLNTSLLQACTHLSPIKEMSPVKSRTKSADMIDGSFEIAFTDFELELINSEANRDEDNDSDEDTFVTYRKHRVKFADDVIISKSPLNYSNDSIPDKIDMSTQTISDKSPDTPKQTLRNRIRNLSEEYSQLKEFTTLEKQLCIEGHVSELQEKLAKFSQFEKQLENVTSDKDAFEHIASELRKKLTEAELRYTLAEDRLNTQATELQRIPTLEKKIAQLSAQEIEMQNVPELHKRITLLTAEKDGYEHVASELRKKLNEVEQRNILLEEKLTGNVEKELIQVSSNNETISSEKDELQRKIMDLQNKLTEAQLGNNLMKDKLEQEQQMLQNLQEEKNVFASEMQNKLRVAEEINNSIRDKLREEQLEMQKFQDQEKQIAQLKSENHKCNLIIDELQEQLIDTKVIISTKEDKIHEHQQDLDTFQHLEDVVKEKIEFECVNSELKQKLKEVELINDSMKNELRLNTQNICALQNQVEILAVQKNECKNIINELEEKLKEVELNNSSKNKSNEYEVNHEIDSLEIPNKTLTLQNNSEQIISELQEKLKDVELYNNSIKEELIVHQTEAQKTIEEHRKSIENFALEKNKLEDTVRELQEKSKKAELDNNLMKAKINEQELQLQKSYDMEKEIECLTLKTKEFESTVYELRQKLANAQHDISGDESNGEQLQKIQLDTQIVSSISERDKDSIKLHQQSLNTSIPKELTNSQSKDEINHLQSRINDLENIIRDIQNENMYLKEQTAKSDNEYDVGGDSSKVTDDLSITKMSLDDSAKLSADLVLKNQELDEIKHDVQSLKADIENLQQTIYLLTTENSELANKLSAAKECNEKSAIQSQQTIDELYARNSKIMDEKLELENNLTSLNEQLETLRLKMPEVNLNEEQIVHKYEKQISEFQAKNTELLSNLTDKMKELEILKESKSLLYEHDCMYKDKLTDLTEKLNLIEKSCENLTVENNNLSTDLMDKVEENEELRQEVNSLKSKLELSLKNKESIDNNDAEQLRKENTLLKIELMELKTNVKTLTEENSKMSSQLMETIEDLDNARKSNSCNDTMHLSTFNNILMNDTMDKSTLDDTAETKTVNLQEEVNHLTNLNKKLSDLKLSTCTQCVHLNELNENRRMLKLEVKALNCKLENLQRKFNSKSAKSDALILKAKEDLNVSACNLSLNVSFSENMNVSYVEERLQSLNNELHILKEDHNKLSNLYKEKCNEVEELQNITDSASNSDDVNSSVRKSPSKTSLRLENIVKVMNDLQNDFKKIKENNESVKSDLTKFINEKESLLDEINTLKTINEELSQQLSESKLLHTIESEKTDILKNEIQDMTKKLQEFTIRYKEIENAKLFLEVEIESLKEDKLIKEQITNELRQSCSYLEHELDLIKKEKDELNNDLILLEQEYEKKLDLLKATNDELTNTKAVISQKFANYSEESENRLIELKEKINKCTSENDYLKQELIKLRDIEDKFEKIKTEYQSKSQQDEILADDNKKLKNILSDTSKNIIKEIKSLKPNVDTREFMNKPVDELFQIFVQTIMMKEKEIVTTMRELFNKEKQKLEDEKRQSVDAEKRTSLWAKELECEIEKLQKDLSEREIASERLQKKITNLEHLLEERNRDKETLKEKNSLLETDLNNLQIEYNKYSKIDTVNEEAIVTAQKREKQAQETIKNKETEFQMKLKSEKEAYNQRIEDLTSTIELFKTKNMDLTSNIECLEANQKQLKNIIDLKSNELMKNNQINQKMQAELEQFTETCNDLHKKLEEKELHITEIKELLKTKFDELTEYKTNLETIMPENMLLKQQIGERKALIGQYKVEIETLKMENKKEIEVIKDQLNFEELKSSKLNKQLAELNDKNMTLLEELNALRDDNATLKRKCAMLEKRMRNSTSKAQAEEQIEELKDLNRSLRSNLDGASNRITELQTAKTDLMKQMVILSSQYDAACKDNQELKETMSSYKSRHNDTYTACEKYDDLLQEKNKIALELEAMKIQLNQKNQDIENYLGEIKMLREKNVEFDQELDELANVIREHDAENARLQDQYYTCRAEADELQAKIKTLENGNKNRPSQSTQKTNIYADRAEKSHDDECSCTTLKNKIRELQLEIALKNGKITDLEVQIRTESFPYQMKCKELQERLSVYSNKNSELKAEIKRLQMAMVRISAKECDVCKQRLINRIHQACQTMPNTLLRFCGTSSGIIDDEIRITKLEKEKQIMKDVCRTRSKTIKELEKQIEEYEKLLHSKNT